MTAFNYLTDVGCPGQEGGQVGDHTYVSGFSVMIPSPGFPGPWMDSIAVE